VPLRELRHAFDDVLHHATADGRASRESSARDASRRTERIRELSLRSRHRCKHQHVAGRQRDRSRHVVGAVDDPQRGPQLPRARTCPRLCGGPGADCERSCNGHRAGETSITRRIAVVNILPRNVLGLIDRGAAVWLRPKRAPLSCDANSALRRPHRIAGARHDVTTLFCGVIDVLSAR